MIVCGKPKQSVHQKHNHCFVACVASMLCDNADTLTQQLQKLIVSEFPLELQKGTKDEGVAVNESAMRNVLVGLGLAQTLHSPGCDDPRYLFNLLVNGGFDFTKVLLCSNIEPKHCWRVVGAYENTLSVMNPFAFGEGRNVSEGSSSS